MILLIFPVVFLASLGSVNGVSVLRVDAGCGFRLTTKGGYNGDVGQLANGQVRAGSDLKQSLFTWFGDAFADQQGRGCWWTPPTSVLQCDWNQQPDHGFQLGCYGGVSYRDQETFYECHTGDGDEVNLYLEPRGANCSEITLHADSCRPPCAGESSPSPASNPTQAPFQQSTGTAGQKSSQTPATHSPSPNPNPSASASTPGLCDVVVASNPDEIVLVDKGNPDTTYGPNPSMLVQLSPNASAIFVFRLAAADAQKQCALVFALPPNPQSPGPLEPGSQYQLSGSGSVSFALLESPPQDPAKTSWNTRPSVAMPLESVTLRPGINQELLKFECPGVEEEVAFEMSDGVGADVCLDYEQWRPEVLVGMYLVKC